MLLRRKGIQWFGDNAILSDFEFETEQYRVLNPTATSAQIAAIDANIKAIKYGAGITLSSVTAKMSLVAPRLVTQSSVDLRPYALIPGVQISISDGTKVAVYSGLTVGTGETYTEKLLDTSFDDTSKWLKENGTITVSGGQGFFTNSGSGLSLYQSNIETSKELYVVSVNVASITSGSIRSALNSVSVVQPLVVGDNVGYLTTVNSGNANIITFSANTTAVVNSFSVKKVLTASTTGLDATTLSDAGINANAASFTITITRP